MARQTSSFEFSPACLQFAHSTGLDNDPEGAIVKLSSALRSKFPLTTSIEDLCRERNIKSIMKCSTTSFEGKLEPLGKSYAEGFNLYLNEKMIPSRMRFTLAHELMHTFFYEYIPNVKFTSHNIDKGEELLCNRGAGELLMPAEEIAKAVKNMPICIATVEIVANKFGVSTETLVRQLQHLKLWDVKLSRWVRLTNGKFVVNGGAAGNAISDCEWIQSQILDEAFRDGKSKSGSAWLMRLTSDGVRQAARIKFDLIRKGGHITVLSGKQVVPSARENVPLFQINKKVKKNKKSKK